MEPRPVNPVDATDAVAPQCSQVQASSTSSIELLVSTRRGHCRPLTPNTTSASTTDASMSQPIIRYKPEGMKDGIIATRS
ncbi:hypothetical protein DVH24_016266 [Malus domestica]|uniref:Uncharacterized protein n=1 Tax=Malus domestica TaxID=3750 RepID=A0A498HT54_MALDO|nr:hypothetical protein DVH24_016266 [Malus domestica]